jgi:hypothetical protein
MEQFTPEQKQQMLFMQLMLMFHQAAWQQMGKVPNPLTNAIERDLEQARMSIDMLDMINARTEGHCSEEETRMLDHLLRELKLNFIDELDREQKAKTAQKEKTAPSESPAATAAEAASPEAGQTTETNS